MLNIDKKTKVTEINKRIENSGIRRKFDLQKSIQMIEESISLAKDIEYYDGLADGYRLLGMLYCYSGVSEKALESLEQAEDIFNRKGSNKEIIAKIYNTYVIFYAEVKKDYFETIKYCKKGLLLAKEQKINDLIQKFTLNLGLVYYQIGLYEDSLALLKESKQFSKLINSEEGELYANANLGNCYFNMGDYYNAKIYYLKTYNKAKEIEEMITFASSSKGLAKLAYYDGETKLAYKYLQEAIKLLSEYNQRGWELNLSLELLEMYIKEQKEEELKILLSRAELIEKNMRNDEDRAKLYKIKAKYSEMIKDYESANKWAQKALEYQEALLLTRRTASIKHIKDSIITAQFEQLEVLSEIGKKITSYRRLEDVYEATYEALKQIYHNFNFAIGLVKEKKVKYDYYNFKGEKLDPFEVDIDDNTSFGNYAINNDETVLINDVQKDYRKYITEFQLDDVIDPDNIADSILIVPLKIQDEIIGVIQLQKYKKYSFSLDDVKMFEVVGSYTAIALKNALQAKEINRAKRSLEKLTEQYEIVLEGNQNAMFLVEVLENGCFRYVRSNLIHQNETGRMLEQIVGKFPQEVFGKEIGNIIAENYKKCVNARKSIRYEEELSLPGGKKIWLSTLTPIIREGKVSLIVGSSIDITKRKELELQLQQYANYDTLTKLPNRRLFFERLERMIVESERDKRRFALLFVDLDGFKDINDKYGHDVGDEVLITVANRLKDSVRKSDTVARMGGDEFTVILRNIKDVSNVEKLINKIHEAIKEVMYIDAVECKINSSIGVAIYPESGEDSSTLLRKADSSMYEIKRSNKGSISDIPRTKKGKVKRL